MKKIVYITLFGILIPSVSFAAGFENTQALIVGIGKIVKTLIPIVFSLALLFFFYGVAKFIWHGGDESKVEEGKRLMVWGVIALFVISSIWGITTFIGETLGIDPDAQPSIPTGVGLDNNSSWWGSIFGR